MSSEPKPLDVPRPYAPAAWRSSSSVSLASLEVGLTTDLARLIDRRETRRTFARPLNDEELGRVLWLACRSRASWPSPFGFDQESRAHPSAGALHPIHTLVAGPGDRWMRHDPIGHRLQEVDASEPGVAAVRAAAAGLIEATQATIMMLVAEPGKTRSKYENAESLVWRDAGVVIGYLSIAAAALDLACCPLGITGEPYALAGWAGTNDLLRPVGVLLLGAIT